MNRLTTKKLSWLISVVGIGAFFVMFGILFLPDFTGAGVGLIILGIIIILSVPTGLIIEYVIKKNKAKEELLKENKLYLWLEDNNFLITDRVGNFLIDSIHKTWCKFTVKKIFYFNEIQEATINRKRSSSTNHFRSYSKGSKSSFRSSTTSTSDTSTYSVYIKTTDYNLPLVEIMCGHSAADAEKICSLISIIKGETKREEKKIDKVAQSKEKSYSATEELKKFKQLLDDGLITQEEYDAKKKQILGL